MNISTMYVAEIIHRERLVQAEQSQRWAHQDGTMRLPDRVRRALSARLISRGERLAVPMYPVEVHS